MHEPTVVDLFSGCGGFGLGAELAGFRSIAAIDIDQDLQSAYRLNFPNTRVIEGNIASLDESCWNDILGTTRPDGIIGGPPCQGFSMIGKRDKDDQRNQLVTHFFRHVNLLKPKFFVMENVEGILKSYGMDLIQSGLESLDLPYETIGPQIVDASKFGAATRRRRAIVIGYLPHEMDHLEESSLFSTKGFRRTDVRGAISDLPEPLESSGEKHEYGLQSLPGGKNDEFPYVRSAQKPPPKEIGWPKAKEWYNEGQISGFFSTRHTESVKRRFQIVKPGSVDKVSKYPKLKWDGFAPTIRAGTGKDRGSFQAVRPIHPDQPRVITVREAARLQGFPDWFVFHPTKWHSFRMIGNSVSPYVSYHLMRRIKKSLA